MGLVEPCIALPFSMTMLSLLLAVPGQHDFCLLVVWKKRRETYQLQHNLIVTLLPTKHNAFFVYYKTVLSLLVSLLSPSPNIVSCCERLCPSFSQHFCALSERGNPMKGPVLSLSPHDYTFITVP